MTDSAGGSVLVSVVIPTFDRCRSLQRLLRALDNQTLPTSAFEVIVAVDGSTDGTAELLRSFTTSYPLRSLLRARAGRAAACNAAIRCAEGEIVVILDDDMEPSPALLDAHRRAHEPDGRRCVVGAAPIVAAEDAPAHVGYIGAKFDDHLKRLASPDHRFEIRDFYSGNASARRVDLLAVGLFDESFRGYGNEDLELAYRLVKNGVELAFSREAVAKQHYEKTLAALAADELAKGRTAVLFAATHPDAVPGLKISALRAQSRPQRALRRTLVWATRAFAGVPKLVVGALQLAARIAPRRLHVAHRFVLDYLYTVGWESEERAEPPSGAPLPRSGALVR